MSFITTYYPLLLQGALTTILAWIGAGIISFTIGCTLGVLAHEKISPSIIICIIRWYTFIMKGIPGYVHILIGYFVIPSVIGIQFSGFATAIIALGLCASGYVTEIIRGGIYAVAPGQWDACKTLGFSHFAAIRYIIFPQALHIITPALIGEYEQLIKSTSLFAAIGITEFTRAGMNIISRELNPIPVYCMIACFYLISSAIFTTIINWISSKNSNS